MNQVSIVGRLTRDPDHRVTDAGMEICRFTVAVDRPRGKDDSNKADYIRVVTWGKTAEVCSKYLKQGKLVGVTGEIRTGSYTNKDGQKVYTSDVNADNVEFLSPKDKGNETAEVYENPHDEFQALQEEIPF